MTDNTITLGQIITLGQRAVACKGWRWMPGMRCVRNDGLSYVVVCAVSATKVEPTWLPDLTDPATLGCLLALVREAYRDASKLWNGYVEVQRDHQSLFFVVQFKHNADGFLHNDYQGTGRTEAEALVAALEGAP